MKKIGMLVISWLLATGLAFAQVNINTAKKDELDGLKGIGPTKAQAIIDYRRKNGPFKTVDDLQNVPGIGPATLQDLRSEVTVSGASRPLAAEPASLPAKRAAEPAPAKPQTSVNSAVPKPASPQAPATVPARPAAPAQSSVPKPAAPAVPGKPAAPEMTKPASTGPAVLAKPAQPSGVPAKPVSVTPPAKPATVAAPASPAGPAKPASPAQPAKPASVPAQ